MIAALYVQSDGCYSGIDGVDLWDEQRDARLYPGPNPIIAHPPCHRWGKMANVNFARYGGKHNEPGNDGGCFKCALSDLRRWGGVLEHPAASYAWDFFGIKKPNKNGWNYCDNGEWVCEVWQSAYGHRAAKATWLLYYDPHTSIFCAPPIELNWQRDKGTHQIGWTDSERPDSNKPTLSKDEANATPVAFRDALIDLAKTVSGK